MDTKVCSRCGVEKNRNDYYYKDKDKKKLFSYCKSCHNKKREGIRKRKEGEKPKRVGNEIYIQGRYGNDEIYNLRKKISFRLAQAIRRGGYTEFSTLYFILGVDWSFFKEYIEEQFLEGMTWGNYGEWHIDHKIPSEVAKTKKVIIKLNYYKNLQPLWAKDNSLKGNKILDEHRILLKELLGDNYEL